MRDRPASSACCTPPARRPGCPRRACGPACRTTSPPPPTRRPRSRCVRRVEGLIGVSVDVSELESAAADYERQVGLAVQSDPDIQAFVERLEQAAEGDEDVSPEDVPSGDAHRARIPAVPAPARAREHRARRGPGAATSPPPGRRSGSRRSSRPHATASARTPGRGSPRRPPSRAPAPTPRPGRHAARAP